MPKTKKYNKKTNKRTNKRTTKKGGAETTKWLQLNSHLINKPNEENILYSIDYNPIADTNKQEPFIYLKHGKNLISYFKVNHIIFNSHNINNEKEALLNDLNENIKTKDVVIKFSNETINTSEMENQYELSKNGQCNDYVCKLYDYGNIVSKKDTLSSIKKKSLIEKIINKKIQNPLIQYNKYILIEDCGQDLLNYTFETFRNEKGKKKISHDIETLIKQLYIVKDMLLGLQCIHKTRDDMTSQGELTVTNSYYYIHGDIKLENIVIKNNPDINDKFKPKIIKYIDFGHSEKVYSNQGPQKKVLGTRMYNAPEHYFTRGENRGNHSKASDIWSLGFTILLLLFNTDFNERKDKDGSFAFLIQRDYYKKDLHENLLDLLNRIIESFYNYYFFNFKKQRQTINKELEDRFVNNLGNFFYYLLHYDPTNRDLDKAIIEFDQLFNIIIDKYHNDIDAPQLQNFSNPFQQYNPFR